MIRRSLVLSWGVQQALPWNADLARGTELYSRQSGGADLADSDDENSLVASNTKPRDVKVV